MSSLQGGPGSTNYTNPLAKTGYPTSLNATMRLRPAILDDTITSVQNVSNDPSIIKEWFDLAHITIMQHEIAYEDVYGFDETGYAMGLIANKKVVTRADMYGRRQVIQPGNREWATSIGCVNYGMRLAAMHHL